MRLADGHEELKLDGQDSWGKHSEVTIMLHRGYSELTVMYVLELSEVSVCMAETSLMTKNALD